MISICNVCICIVCGDVNSRADKKREFAQNMLAFKSPNATKNKQKST